MPDMFSLLLSLPGVHSVRGIWRALYAKHTRACARHGHIHRSADTDTYTLTHDLPSYPASIWQAETSQGVRKGTRLAALRRQLCRPFASAPALSLKGAE